MDGTAAHLVSLAAGRRRAFDGHHAASASGRVHAVAFVELLGQDWPTAACHTAILGGEVANLAPTTAPVTCRRCLRLQGVDPATEHPTLF